MPWGTEVRVCPVVPNAVLVALFLHFYLNIFCFHFVLSDFCVLIRGGNMYVCYSLNFLYLLHNISSIFDLWSYLFFVFSEIFYLTVCLVNLVQIFISFRTVSSSLKCF